MNGLLLLLSAAVMVCAAIGKGHQMIVLRKVNKQLLAVVEEMWKDEICPHCGKTIAGFPAVVDPTMPAGTVEMRDAKGNVVGVITGLPADTGEPK
jgi:hypothetical protein